MVLKLISFKEKTGLIQETSLSTLHTWNSCSPPANEPSFLRKCLCACHLCRQRISLAARPPGSVSAFCTRVSSLQSSCPSPGLIHQLPLFLGNSATADSSGTPVPGPGLRRGPSLTHTTPSGPQAVVPHGEEALTHTTPSGPQAPAPLGVGGAGGWGLGQGLGTGQWTLGWHQSPVFPSSPPTPGARRAVTTRPPACPPLWPTWPCPRTPTTPCRSLPCATSGNPRPCECPSCPHPAPAHPQSP